MKKNGISLIVLVITIIIIIILAGAIILSLSNNNPITSANRSVCKSDIAELKSAVALDIASKLSNDTTGTITYVKPTTGTIGKIITRIQDNYVVTVNISAKGEITFSTTDSAKLNAIGLQIVDGEIVDKP
ncbi:MAG: hypothetical protein RSE41_01720 [Clostridia bacterium]